MLAHGPRALPKGVEIPLIGRVNVGGTTVFAEAERRGAAAVSVHPAGQRADELGAGADQNTTQRELIPAVPSAYAAVPITSVMVAPQVDRGVDGGRARRRRRARSARRGAGLSRRRSS